MIGGVLGFLGSKIAGYAAVAGAVILVLVTVYNAGVSSERKRGEAATLRAQIAIERKDLEIARSAEKEATKRTAELETSVEANKKVLNDLRLQLKNRPVDQRCVLGVDDARRLRDIR